jgi:hypothetical protein
MLPQFFEDVVLARCRDAARADASTDQLCPWRHRPARPELSRPELHPRSTASLNLLKFSTFLRTTFRIQVKANDVIILRFTLTDIIIFMKS